VVGRRLVAVIDWRSAALLKVNASFVAQAAAAGKITPRERRAGATRYRSLTLWDDGSCELQRFSTAAAARRLGGKIVPATARKARKGQRG